MQKQCFSSWLKLIALALLALVMAACHRGEIKQGTTSDVAQTPGQYDLTVMADKDNQFELYGATLNTEDLRSHIRYLNETGQTVHSILLKRGEKQKITNDHVAGMAGIARDLKADAYVLDNDGRLKQIKIADDPIK